MFEDNSLFQGSKWELLQLIAEKPRDASELAKLKNTSLANITQQLKLLEAAGIIVSSVAPKDKTKSRTRGKPKKVYRLNGSRALIMALTPLFSSKAIIKPTPFEAALLRVMLMNSSKKEEIIEKLLQLYKYMKDIELIALKNDNLLIKSKREIKVEGIKRIRNLDALKDAILLYAPT